MRRNIEEIRRTPVKPPVREDAMGLTDAIRVSLMMNPALWNEPYLTQLRRIARRAAAREADPALRAPLADLAAVLELPLPQRTFRLVKRDFDLKNPLIEADNVYDVATVIGNAPDDEMFDLLVANFLEPMDQSARAAARWAPLAGCYFQLTYDAEHRNRRELLDLCATRMIDILKEHQSYRSPLQSTSGVAPYQVANRLIELNRVADLSDLIKSSTGIHRFQFVMFRIGQHVQRDQIDQARVVTRNELAPIAPDIADRLLQSMSGQVVPILPEPKQPLMVGTRRIAREADPQELNLRSMLAAMAHHHVRSGNLDLATRQLIALQQDAIALSHARDELRSDTWWSLCSEARAANHPEVAQLAFEHEMTMYAKEHATSTPETLPVDMRLVREALSLGDWDLVIKVQGGNSVTGPLFLARAYIDRRNIERAKELLEEARAKASEFEIRDELLNIAVEMYQIGQRDAALAILTETEQAINGDIFGMGFVGEFIRAAVIMDRLDLLEQAYSQSNDPSRRLLLCMVATQTGLLMESGKLHP